MAYANEWALSAVIMAHEEVIDEQNLLGSAFIARRKKMGGDIKKTSTTDYSTAVMIII